MNASEDSIKKKAAEYFGGPVREGFFRWDGNQALALILPNARAAQRAFQSSRRDPRAQGILWSVFCASFRTEISQRRLVFNLSLLCLDGLCRLNNLKSEAINDGALGRRLGEYADISAPVVAGGRLRVGAGRAWKLPCFLRVIWIIHANPADCFQIAAIIWRRSATLLP